MQGGRHFFGLIWLQVSGLLKIEVPYLWDSDAGIKPSDSSPLLKQWRESEVPPPSQGASCPFFLLLLSEDAGSENTQVCQTHKHTRPLSPPQAEFTFPCLSAPTGSPFWLQTQRFQPPPQFWSFARTTHKTWGNTLIILLVYYKGYNSGTDK